MRVGSRQPLFRQWRRWGYSLGAGAPEVGQSSLLSSRRGWQRDGSLNRYDGLAWSCCSSSDLCLPHRFRSRVGFPVGGGSQENIVNVGGSDYTTISLKAGETQARVLGQTPRRKVQEFKELE